ncbi:alpha/beta fold hydrolase [Rhodoferax sediminis]|uniref:Alpha/beta hydrolase n=1 Tax=Rhodoferax sediminis TaxID=2509614 RepID=A0A515DE17_9BURK|nr:alpha/beta hydrolase [Rhodoferax sediminis]QDL38653.1 alpha/beta hydrolase [Rhodoferax sediminis]
MPLLRVGDADLFYRDDDFADPWQPHDTVMLQHGFGRSGNMYYGWVPHLSRDFRVIRMDLRRFGQSADPGPGIRFALDGLMADFIGMLDALNIERVHYVGESLGSILGIALAATHPDRVKSLTLVSAIVRARPEKTGKVVSLGYPSWAEALQAVGMKEWWLKSRAITNELTGNSAKDNWFADECDRTPVHVGQAMARFAPTINAEPMLARVQAPTLVLSPGISEHTDPAEQQAILDAIPNSRQIQYPGAKHIDCYLEPDKYARDTRDFLLDVVQRDQRLVTAGCRQIRESFEE